MTSILTNNSAMNALSTLRNINNNLGTTQDRISSGLKVSSAKDNAAYFQISETMKGDSSAYSSINEGLTLTKNSIATARLGAESFQELAGQFTERLAFAQGAKGGFDEIGKELNEIVKQMTTTIQQSTFNGDDMVNAVRCGSLQSGRTSAVDAATGALTAATETGATRNVVTGVSRSGGSFAVTNVLHVDQTSTSDAADFAGSERTRHFAANAKLAERRSLLEQRSHRSGKGIFAKATDARPLSAWQRSQSRTSKPSCPRWSKTSTPVSGRWSMPTWKKRRPVFRRCRCSSSWPRSRSRSPTRGRRTS